MNPNLLSKLPFLGEGKADRDLTPEEIEEAEAQAKRDRIAFHRDHVRNGPAKFKQMTTGQERRARHRSLDSMTRKGRRRQIRQYHADMREAATLRGHLQAAGVVRYASEFHAPDFAIMRSIIWIVRHFAEGDENGRIEVTHEVVIDAIEKAWQRWCRLTGQPVVPLSPAYRLPVAVADES